MFLNSLKAIYQKHKGENPIFVRNLLKENIQYYILHYISQSKWAQSFIFKGGTCLRIFFDLPRLSEDLDFDIQDIDNFDIDLFLRELKDYFISTMQYKNLEFKLAGNGRTAYVKFPILDEIGIPSDPSESNVVFVRVDVAPAVGSVYSTEIAIKSISSFSLLIKRYALPDLFAGKIAAILTRETIEGTVKTERTKGRDYYDLIWYLEKNILPNWEYLTQITGYRKEEILQKLNEKVEKVDTQIIYDDLSPLFQDNNFVKMFSQNIRSIYAGMIGRLTK